MKSILFWHFLSFQLPFSLGGFYSAATRWWGGVRSPYAGWALGLLLSGCVGQPSSPAPASPTAAGSPTVFLPSSPAPSPVKTPEKSQTVKALEQKLKLDLVKKANITVQKVDCPLNVRVEPGKTFDCQATAEGKTFTLTISWADKSLPHQSLPRKKSANQTLPDQTLPDQTLTNKTLPDQNQGQLSSSQPNQGGVQTHGIRGDGLQWSTKGLLVLPKLEKTIQQGIQEQFGVAVKTHCRGKVRIAKPGDTFTCQLTDGKGERSVTVRVDDEQGNVTWKL